MGSKIEYVESSHVYVTNYVRNSKAVGVLWGIFTICYAIIIIVSFVTPEWIGDTSASENAGRFGLWTRCFFRGSSELSGIGVEECVGQLDDFGSIVTVAFKAATVLVGISVIIALLTLGAMLLFFFFASTKVFMICGWMQLMSALFLILGVLTYPAGWDSPEIRQICGPNASSYELGECGIRWSYLLAGIGCFDALILSTLAFILASKHVKLQPEQGHMQGGQIFKEDMNGPYLCDAQSLAGSRKSLNIHPVLMMPQPGDLDRYSEFSNRTDLCTAPIDLIILALLDSKSTVKDVITPAARWANDNRAHVLAIDPPQNGTPGVTAKYSLVPALPLAYDTCNGKIYLCNIGIPLQVFKDVGISQYVSPFGPKFFMPLYPNDI